MSRQETTELFTTDQQPATWIQKTPGVCGGDACIRNTRITVWGLVQRRQQGLSDAEVLRRVPGLTPADLEAAWDYYERSHEEIEQAIRDNEEA
jgi:type III restriction enzyme